jgi:hypothetical protein
MECENGHRQSVILSSLPTTRYCLIQTLTKESIDVFECCIAIHVTVTLAKARRRLPLSRASVHFMPYCAVLNELQIIKHDRGPSKSEPPYLLYANSCVFSELEARRRLPPSRASVHFTP